MKSIDRHLLLSRLFGAVQLFIVAELIAFSAPA